MCGITGWISDSGPVDRGVLERMTQRLAHRGPDGGHVEVFSEGRSGFGHRRLAILDLSEAGRQPMGRDGHWVVHNGEIYNFPELRTGLEKDGVRFAGHSDTEVLLALLSRTGSPGLDRLSGMFAFAYWDPRDRCLLLARDRLGIKPLYYCDRGDAFLFASEPKALLAHPEIAARLDPEAACDFLSYGYVPFDRSIYAGIRKLPPGHCLLRRDGRVVVRSYWEPQPVALRADLIEQVRELLDESVRSHALSDVPVGTFLSGGLDSTAVTALLQRRTPGKVKTFTVAYSDGGLEDLKYSRIAAEAIGTEHTEQKLALGSLDEGLGRLADYYDEPISDATSLAVFHLAALARRQVKVVLSGDGGDEAFGGYGWYQSASGYETWRRRLAPLSFLLGAIDRAAAARPASSRLAGRLAGARKITGRDGASRFFAVRGFFSREERRSVLPDLPGPQDDAWLFRKFYRADEPPIRRYCYLDLMTYLPDNNLALVDRSAMAHGLEVRVPLLDHRLVEMALSLPDRLLASARQTKILFREAIRPWVAPAIASRGKYGFSPPFKSWASENDGTTLLAALENGRLRRDGLLRVDRLARLIEAGVPRRWNKLWLMFTLEAWYRRWIVEPATAPPLPSR